MDDFESAVVQHYQFLVKSALSFTREHSLSQDLVQDTVLSALAKRHLFVPGTNLKAWLYTILRNRFFTIKRKHRETEDPEGFLEARLSVQPNQHDHLEYLETQEIISDLPEAFKQAVILAGNGFSYKEMATTLQVAEGTVKSRVARGRKLLSQIVSGELPLPNKERRAKAISIAPRPSIAVPSVQTKLIPAEQFNLIGRDLRQQKVQIYRFAKP